MKPIAYEGDKPYIFVSYAHKDSEQTYKVLGELVSRGYRLWYDDGIAPGSEWPEDIAQHLINSAMVVAFVTPNSMASQNCRREINFALSREKPFLSIVMEPTEMPLGMEMQLSAQQSIIRQNYNTWDRFIEKILSCPGLEPCREVPAAPEPAEVEVAERGDGADGSGAAQQTDVTSPVTNVGQTVGLPVDAGAGRTPVVAAAAEEAPANAAGAKKRKRPILPIVAIVILAIVALIAFFSCSRGYKTSWGGYINDTSTSVSVIGKALTQEDLEAILGSEQLTSLSLEDCDLSACDLSGLTFASDEMMNLTISRTVGSEGFSEIIPTLALRTLDLTGCAWFDDLGVLDTSSLTRLGIGETGVDDLSGLVGTSVTELDFHGTQVADASPLAEIPSLASVNGSDTAVTSIDCLATLEGLTSIDFSGCELEDVTDRFHSLSLSYVDLSDTGITDASGLSDSTILKYLDLSGNAEMTDVSWIDPQNHATLTTLDLSRTGLDAEDVAWVSVCASLVSLSLDGIELGALDMCAGLGSLEYLSAINCGVTDASGIRSCTSLTKVLLAFNQIEDVSMLECLAADSYPTVDLSHNSIASLAELPIIEYRGLMLHGNAPDLAATFPAGVTAREVSIEWCENIANGGLMERGSISELCLLGCPANQALAMQDALGAYLSLVSEEELLQMYAEDSFEYSLGIGSDYYLELSGAA